MSYNEMRAFISALPQAQITEYITSILPFTFPSTEHKVNFNHIANHA